MLSTHTHRLVNRYCTPCSYRSHISHTITHYCTLFPQTTRLCTHPPSLHAHLWYLPWYLPCSLLLQTCTMHRKYQCNCQKYCEGTFHQVSQSTYARHWPFRPQEDFGFQVQANHSNAAAPVPSGDRNDSEIAEVCAYIFGAINLLTCLIGHTTCKWTICTR